MTDRFSAIVLLLGALPLAVAWRANRHSSLVHALGWTAVAWAFWGGVLASAGWRGEPSFAAVYVALVVSGCAGVAVLGARRPGDRAWHFVVLGLVAIALLPLGEAAITGRQAAVSAYRLAFLGAVLSIGVLNYLPTRLGPAALCLAFGTGIQLWRLTKTTDELEARNRLAELGRLAIALTPWVAYACMSRGPRGRSLFDALWIDFRDRFGLVWGQRLREQFNRSAMNAGWPVFLYWRGLRRLRSEPFPPATEQDAMIHCLRALMKRFEADHGPPGPPPAPTPM